MYQKNVFIGIDPVTGKRRHKTLYDRSKSELNKKASLLVSSVELGTYADDKNFTFEKWAERWLKITKADKCASSVRSMPLPDALYHVLKSYCGRSQTIYLFCAAGGKLMSQGAYRRFWERIRNKVNA